MLTRPPEKPTGTATILFTDLVDSTVQRARLGEEAAEALRRTHDRLLREAVIAHHGTVVKSFGDGIMATFGGAAEAVAAAVAIQQAIDGHNRRTMVPHLAVRVGVSLGDVSWEGEDCFGAPVIEAARICAAAEAGQILAAEVVRLSARGRGGHIFIPIGPVALKGLPEPVVTCAVAWEPHAAAGIPLPPRLRARPPFALFGRGEESETLARAWAKARDGQRQVVFLAGEPGIGKTRLATEAACAAYSDGGIVLFGGCDEDVGLPYRPFAEALGHYVTHAPDEVLASHVQTHRGELTRLVPELARRVLDLPAPQVAASDTERFLLFEAVTGLLAAASRERPIVLVLDDVQWAGAPALLLLRHVVRSAQPMRLLVIATYRDTDLSRSHPLIPVLADLRRDAGIERVLLHGLDDAAVEPLVAAAARHELDEALVALAHAIRRETEGNPFFIGEVIQHLAESGALFEKQGRWTYRGAIESLGIPEGVREVIGRRLGRLSEAASHLLGLAAVIGRQFDVSVLAKTAAVSEDAVLDALDEAVAAALVHEVHGTADAFAFRHGLVRTALYEELSAPRRARLHQRVGEVLEELTRAAPGARIEELAHHWLAATTPTAMGKAVGYARQAGERAVAGLAFEAAVTYFERALEVLDPCDRDGERLHCDLLLALGDAQKRAGNASYRETVAKAVAVARALGDGERLARAALASARPGGFLTSANVADEELIALYEEANAALGPADSVLRARVLGQLAVELVCTPDRDRRDALSREAVTIARRLGDQTGLTQVLILRLLAMTDPFTLAERLEVTAELAALARALSSSELAWHAAFHRTGALLESGNVESSELSLAELEQVAGKLRQPFYTWIARMGRTMFAVLRGAPDAEAQVSATFELGRAAGQPDAAAAFGAQLNNVLHNQGRLAETADAARANVEALPHLPVWRADLARLYCETDQVEQARAQLELFRANGFDAPLDWSWTAYMVMVSGVVSDLREPSAAAILYERLRPIAGQVDVLATIVACGGSYGLHCGMLAACLGRWDAAERHFADGLATNERLGARPYAVRTRRAWATMLVDRGAPGDASRARELVACGRAEAEALGMARELIRFERLTERLQSAPTA